MALTAYDIIKRPILTEKTTYAMNEQQRFSFEVDMRATKPEIKASIETLYSVKVDRVWTSIKKYRNRRSRFGIIEGPEMKRATVTLKGDATIELF